MAGIGDLLEKWKLGGMSLDDKLSILEHYDIKFDRREIARELSNSLEGSLRDAKRDDYTAAIEKATKEQVQKAVHKVLDTHVKEAEARFRTELSKRFKEKTIGKKAAAKLLWRWISVLGDGRRCPDCKERHGLEKLMKIWEKLGIPRSGKTVCKHHCRCRLAAVDKPPDEAKPDLEPEKPKGPPTGAEVRKELEGKYKKIQETEEKLRARSKKFFSRMDEVYDSAPDSDWMKNPASVKEMKKLAELADGNTAKLVKLREIERRLITKTLKAHNPVDLGKPVWSKKTKYFSEPIKKPQAALKRNVKEAQSFIEEIVEGDTFTDPGYRYARGYENLEYEPGKVPYGVVTKRKGARASCGGSSLNLANDDSVSTVIHEMGHLLEHRSKAITKKALSFLEERAKITPEGLTDIYGNGEEWGWKDKFISHYMGKNYDGRATELVSMGLQHLYTSPAHFLAKDPEYFEWIVNIIKGY